MSGSILKPGAFKLWVYLISTCTAPPRWPASCTRSSRRSPSVCGWCWSRRRRGRATCQGRPRGTRSRSRGARGVALQVAFERQTLKPAFHLIGYRLWFFKAIGYGLWVNLIQRAEPHRGCAAWTAASWPLSDPCGARGACPPPRCSGHKLTHSQEQTLKPGFHFIGFKGWVTRRPSR
jgi:hypothetical protein